MIINSIKLTNFRNHDGYSLICNPDTTLILGKNGCGKTSVLEAIYIATRGKSFRATDQDIIKRGTSFYRIELTNDAGELTTVTYDGKNKTYNIMNKKTRRLPKIHKYPVILFQPSDLNLISGSPSRHREYFDRFFSGLSEEYDNAISKYEKSLRQRNELLKSNNTNKAALFSWNILLAKYGTIIERYRRDFTEQINQHLTPTYLSIANNEDTTKLVYQTTTSHNDENVYLNSLEMNYDKDIYLGHTTYGVHKDNFEFEFNHKIADGSASRGETRSIIIALKFIESNMIYHQIGKKPLILLDDVFSELDDTRRRCLVNNFKNHQVIITSVEDFTPQ